MNFSAKMIFWHYWQIIKSRICEYRTIVSRCICLSCQIIPSVFGDFYALSRTFCFVLQIHPPNFPNAFRQIRTISAAVLCTFFGEFLQNSFPVGGPLLVVVYCVSLFPISELPVAFPAFFYSNFEHTSWARMVYPYFYSSFIHFLGFSPARLQKTRRATTAKVAHIAARRARPRGKLGNPDRKTLPTPAGRCRMVSTQLGSARLARRRQPAPERCGSPG